MTYRRVRENTRVFLITRTFSICWEVGVWARSEPVSFPASRVLSSGDVTPLSPVPSVVTRRSSGNETCSVAYMETLSIVSSQFPISILLLGLIKITPVTLKLFKV